MATNIVELNAQPGLAEHLRTSYPRVPFDDPPPAGAPSILVYDLRPSRLEPEREELNFGGLAGGTVATGPQTVLITGSSGAAWTARSSNPVFLVSPESGTGSGSIVISVRLPLVRSGGESESGTVSILRDDGVAVPPVRVGLAVFEPGKSAPPIGYLDAPPGDVDAATGPVFISGWALDDIEVFFHQRIEYLGRI